MTIVKFNPNTLLANKAYNYSRFSDLFDNVFGTDVSPSQVCRSYPKANIIETENNFRIDLAVPGLTKEDFKINLEENKLSVSAHKDAPEENEIKYNRKEFDYTKFEKTFILPKTVDKEKISATYENGVLALAISKKDEAIQGHTKQINIL